MDWHTRAKINKRLCFWDQCAHLKQVKKVLSGLVFESFEPTWGEFGCIDQQKVAQGSQLN